jgi:hypothetical protein
VLAKLGKTPFEILKEEDKNMNVGKNAVKGASQT